jgi:hypothetical protein
MAVLRSAAAVLDIEESFGSDLPFSFSYPTGTDLTGYTFTWVIETAGGSPYTGSVASETVTFSVPNADLDALDRGSYNHYIIRTVGGIDKTIIRGLLTLL